MVKMPGQNPHKNKFHRKPQPKGKPVETDIKEVRGRAAKKPASTQNTHKALLRTLLRALASLRGRMRGRILKKKLPSENAVRAKRGKINSGRLRVLICSGGMVIITALLLLIFLAPGSAAEPASDSPSASQPAMPVFAPVPTTEPDVAINAIPTTEPDAAQTPAPKPTATPKPKPTATPKPKPTATPKPKPTTTPKPKPTATTKPTATPEPEASKETKTTDLDTLAKYYVVTADSYYNDVNYSSNHYQYTDAELTTLAQIIYAEARGESEKGKIAVGNVVLNRVLCSHYGNTIDSVKSAFACSSKTPSQSCINAAKAVLDDEVWVVPQNTYFFKTSGGSWGSKTLWAQIDHQYFYTYNYGGRYTGNTVPDALYKRVYKHAQYGCKPEGRVKRIQIMLGALGYDIVSTDGYFGLGTKNALIQFQKDKGLEADGVAGPATVKALIGAYGVEKYCEDFL